MIVGGENLPICVLDVVSYTAMKEKHDCVMILDDRGAEYLFIPGYPCIFRKQKVTNQ